MFAVYVFKPDHSATEETTNVSSLRP